MHGPMWPFYSCMSLMTCDTGITQVDELSTRHPGMRASHWLTRHWPEFPILLTSPNLEM